VTELPSPSAELVAKHVAAYDADKLGGPLDDAVAKVFTACPGNTLLSHVLAKTSVLNALFATNILAIRSLAMAMCGNGERIDEFLNQGSPDVLPLLAKQERSGGKTRDNDHA
jgi:hypothetical protein